MITENLITELVGEHLSGTGIFLVELAIRPGNRIMLFIDGDQGVSIRDCQELSRYIESKLDRDSEDYDLTVSSSGADQSLLLPRQYPKHTGRTLEITLKDGKTHTGKLVNVTDSSIGIETIPTKKIKTTEQYVLDFKDIKEAKVTLAFKR